MKIQLSSLIWQPTFICQNNCPNCYVSRSTMKVFNEQKQRQLLSLLCSEEVVVDNEVIISLDTIPKKKKAFSNEISFITDLLQVGKFKRHLAARDINTLSFWMKKLGTKKYISKISLSNIDNLNKYKDLIGNIPVNYNLLSSRYNGEDIDTTNLSSIHCILEKNPLGEKQSFDNYYKFLACGTKLQLKHRNKMVFDRCLAAINSKKPCSACIDKICIWPDGSLTGCPYDSLGKMKYTEDNILETLNKIVYERTEHPSSICKLYGLT